MKKTLILLMILIVVGIFASGCAGDSVAADAIADVDTNNAGTANADAPASIPDSIDDTDTIGDVSVDVDLSALSSTMAQAKFINIMQNSDDYLGRTIRVQGPYFSMPFPQTDEHLHFVMVIEGDECCRMGFEFMVSGDTVYPYDYPAQYAMIEIVGIISMLEEFGQYFLYIATDEIVLL